jgi:ClpX C4-type zinc finger protein
MLSSSHGPETPRSTPVIDCSRLLCYAIVDNTVQFSGRTLLFVDGKELGRVPCLAICENKKLSEVLLFHCDSEWNTLGCSAHPSVAEAKARAERIYAGISARWVDAGVSEQTAEDYMNKQFGNERCSFCGKRPDEVDQVILKEDQRKHEVRICDRCINEFYKELPRS